MKTEDLLKCSACTNKAREINPDAEEVMHPTSQFYKKGGTRSGWAYSCITAMKAQRKKRGPPKPRCRKLANEDKGLLLPVSEYVKQPDCPLRAENQMVRL